MTEDRDKWRKYVDGVANPRIDDGYRTEQNSSLAAVDLVRLLWKKTMKLDKLRCRWTVGHVRLARAGLENAQTHTHTHTHTAVGILTAGS